MPNLTVRKDITQRHLESWEASYFADNDRVGAAQFRGAAVRAAISAEWLMNGSADPFMDVDAVGDMTPAEVKALAEAIDERYKDVIAFDPNS